MEDRVSQKLGSPTLRFGKANDGSGCRFRIFSGQHPDEIGNIDLSGRLVEGDADAPVVEEAEIDPFLGAPMAHLLRIGATDSEGVEELRMVQGETQ